MIHTLINMLDDVLYALELLGETVAEVVQETWPVILLCALAGGMIGMALGR